MMISIYLESFYQNIKFIGFLYLDDIFLNPGLFDKNFINQYVEIFNEAFGRRRTQVNNFYN